MQPPGGKGEMCTRTRTFEFVPHPACMTDSGEASLSEFTHALAELIDNSIEATASRHKLKMNKERVIKVDCLFSTPSKGSTYDKTFNGYVVVSDNGGGMTEANLQRFATYALNKDLRQETGSSSESASIGKYGVGAKQSAFWLGDRIHVLTKPAIDVPGLENDVLEFVMARDKIEGVYEKHRLEREKAAERGETEQKVPNESYNSEMKWRHLFKDQVDEHGNRVSNCDLLAPDDERECTKLMEIISRHESKYRDGFTIVVVKLKPKIAKMIYAPPPRDEDKKRFPQCYHFPTELAQIYYFHLHPEHHPLNIGMLPKFKGKVSDKISDLELTAGTKLDRSTTRPIASNLKISFSVHKQGVDNKWSPFDASLNNCDIGEVRDAPPLLHVSNAQSVFLFSMGVLKPKSSVTEKRNKSSKELETSGLGKDDFAQVMGMVFYFPFKDGRETRPLPNAERKWHRIDEGEKKQSKSTPAAGGRSSRRRPEGDDDDDDDEQEGGDDNKGMSPMTPNHDDAATDPDSLAFDDNDDEQRREMVKSENIFDIYWSDRHVCKAGANKFDWMPSAISLPDCIKSQLPLEWRGRIKGYLFFQGGTGTDAWDAIANNKLNLTLNGDLDTYLSTSTARIPKDTNKELKTKFLDFLQKNHRIFDKKFRCDERDRELENAVKEELGAHDTMEAGMTTIAFFKSCTFCDKTLRVGDFVKLYMTSVGNIVTKKTAGGKTEHYAQIVAFSDKDQTLAEADIFEGSPMVHFLLLPLALYHPDLKEVGSNLSKADYIPPMTAVFAHTVKIGALDLSSSSYKLEGKDRDLKKHDEKCKEKILDRVRFTLFPSKLKEGTNLVLPSGPVGSKIVTAEGDYLIDNEESMFYKFGFQLIDKKGDVRVRPPQGVVKVIPDYYIKYELDSGPNAQIASNVETILWYWDASTGTDRMASSITVKEGQNLKKGQDAKRGNDSKKADDSRKAEDVYFSVYNGIKPIILPPGRHKIRIRVMEEVKLDLSKFSYSREMLVANFVLVVDKSGVTSCRIDVDSLVSEKILRNIGSFLPRTTITLLDAQGNEASGSAEIQVTVSAKLVVNPKKKHPLTAICYAPRLPNSSQEEELDEDGFVIPPRGRGLLESAVSSPNKIRLHYDNSIVLGTTISQTLANDAWTKDKEKIMERARAAGTSKEMLKMLKGPELYDMRTYADFSSLEDYEDWFLWVVDDSMDSGGYYTNLYGDGGGWRIDFSRDGVPALLGRNPCWNGNTREVEIDVAVEILRGSDGKPSQMGQEEEWDPLGKKTYTIDFKDCHKVCTVRQDTGASSSKAGGKSAATSQASSSSKKRLREVDGESLIPQITDDGRLIVTEGQALPSISFELLDRYGIITSPKPEIYGGTGSWELALVEHRLIEGLKSEDASATTSSSAPITFSHLVCRRQDDEQDPIPDCGLESTIRFILVDEVEEYKPPFKCTEEWLRLKYRPEADWEPEKDPFDVIYDAESNKCKLKLSRRKYTKYASEQGRPFCDVPLLIMPDRSPRSLKIFCGDLEVGAIAGGLSVPSGLPVTDLTLRLYDALDNQLDIDRDWFSSPVLPMTSKSQDKRKKGSHVTISWAPNTYTLDLPLSDEPLRCIQLPDVPAIHTKACGKIFLSVALLKWSLPFDFELRVRPGAAINWKLAVREDLGEEGLVSGSARDFASKILFVSQSDAEMREVPCMSSGPTPMPQVLVYASDPSRPSGRAKRQKKRGKSSSVPRGHQTKRRRARDEDDDDDDDDDEIRSVDEDEETGSPQRKNTPPLPSSAPDHTLLPSTSVSNQKARLSMQHAARQGLRMRMDEEEEEDEEEDDGDLNFDDSELEPIATWCPVLHSTASMQQDGREKEEGYFYFPSCASISLPYSEDVDHRYVWIVVKDSSKRLQACIKRIELTNDVPHALQVRAPALGLREFAGSSGNGIVAQVSSFAQEVDVEVLVVDKDGLPAHAAPSSRVVRNLVVTLVSNKASSKPLVLTQMSRNPLIFSAKAFDAYALFAPPRPSKRKTQKKKKSREAAMEVDAEQADPEAVQAEAAVLANPQLVISGQFRNAAGDDEDLVGVALNCQHHRMNNVVKMRVAAADAGEGHGALPSGVHAEVDCGAALSDLFLTVETDDGQLYIPAPDQVECTVHYSDRSSGGKRSLREAGQLFRGSFQVDPARGGLSLSFLDPSHLEDQSWEVGYLSISFTYTETRVFEGVLAAFAPVSETFVLKVVASSPHSLVPFDNKTLNRLMDNLMVSNSPGQSSIAKGLQFKATDRFGNDAKMDMAFTFHCTVRHARPEADVGIIAMPRLKDADPAGYISASPTTAEVVVFPSLDFEVGQGAGSGQLELVFGCADIRGMVEFVALLTFTDDAERMKREGEKQREYADLLEKIENYKAEECALKLNVDEKHAAMRDFLTSAHATGLSSMDPADSLGEYEKEWNKIKKEITDMQNGAKNRRKMVEDFSKQPRAVQEDYYNNKRVTDGMSHEAVRGLVAKVGYAQDKKTAELLSWITGTSRMLRAIAQSATVQKELISQRVSCFSVMNSQHYAFKGSGKDFRHRSESEKKSKQLPHIVPVSYPGSAEPVRGNPQAIVNLVQLADKDEDLRDTIFYNIFSKSLLFDTFADATDFHTRVCAHNRKYPGAPAPPTVYGMQNGVVHKMGMDGSQDFREGILTDEKAKGLPLVFGEMPPNQDSSFKFLQFDNTLLAKSIIPCVRERDEAEQAMQAFLSEREAECKEWVDRLQEIGQECLEEGIALGSQADKVPPPKKSRGRRS